MVIGTVGHRAGCPALLTGADRRRPALRCPRWAAAGGGATGSPQRFVIAEVHDGQITELRGYADEAEARAALTALS